MGVGYLQESRLGQLLQCRIVLQTSLRSFTPQLEWKPNSWARPTCKAYLEPCPLAPATLASFTSNPHRVPSPPHVLCALCSLLWGPFFLFLVNSTSIRTLSTSSDKLFLTFPFLSNFWMELCQVSWLCVTHHCCKCTFVCESIWLMCVSSSRIYVPQEQKQRLFLHTTMSPVLSI